MPKNKHFLLVQLCSSGPSISAHRLWHMPFSLFVPFLFYSCWWDIGKGKQRRQMCRIHTHMKCSLSAQVYLQRISSGEHALQACFLSTRFVRPANYQWMRILNLHLEILIQVRPPCTYSNKSPIISKLYCFMPCFLYLCCIARHTFYTSEHHFLPLHKYQYCMNERRSHGLSPHSCLEKQRMTKNIEIQAGCIRGCTCMSILGKRRFFWTFGIHKAQALIINFHVLWEQTDMQCYHHFTREENSRKRVKQHCKGQTVQQCCYLDQYTSLLIPQLH